MTSLASEKWESPSEYRGPNKTIVVLLVVFRSRHKQIPSSKTPNQGLRGGQSCHLGGLVVLRSISLSSCRVAKTRSFGSLRNHAVVRKLESNKTTLSMLSPFGVLNAPDFLDKTPFLLKSPLQGERPRKAPYIPFLSGLLFDLEKVSTFFEETVRSTPKSNQIAKRKLKDVQRSLCSPFYLRSVKTPSLDDTQLQGLGCDHPPTSAGGIPTLGDFAPEKGNSGSRPH